MADFDSMTPMRGNKQPRVEEQAQVLQFPAEEFIRGRFVGPVTSFVMIWFNLTKKDGTKTKVPRICLDYDPTTQKMVRDICPYRASGLGQISQVYYTNFLVRDIQDAKPRKIVKPSGKELKKRTLLDDFKAHVKEFNTKTWTPYRLVRLTTTLAEKSKNLGSLNVVKVKGVAKKFSIAHPKYGIDVQIMYNPNAKGALQYELQRDDRTPLTEEELDYPFQPLQLSAMNPLSVKEANRDWEELKKVIIKPGDDEDPEDGDKKGNKNKKNKERDRDEKPRNKDRDRDSKSSKSSKSSEKRSSKSKDRKKSSKDENKGSKKKKKNKEYDSDWNM